MLEDDAWKKEKRSRVIFFFGADGAMGRYLLDFFILLLSFRDGVALWALLAKPRVKGLSEP